MVRVVGRNYGLLSNNHELIVDFKENGNNGDLRQYRSIDAVKGDEISMLFIDVDFFESADLVQFYLSKIRKKLQGIPVVLILRVGYLDYLNVDWFFDEFILYPFRKNELKTRVKRLLWDKNLIDDANIIGIGNLKINLSEYSVYMNNEKLDFTYKEFELLRLFVQNRGLVFTRKDLLEKIWGMEYIGGTRTVDVHIRRLRSKLGDEFNSVIETVRNVGYRCRV